MHGSQDDARSHEGPERGRPGDRRRVAAAGTGTLDALLTDATGPSLPPVPARQGRARAGGQAGRAPGRGDPPLARPDPGAGQHRGGPVGARAGQEGPAVPGPGLGGQPRPAPGAAGLPRRGRHRQPAARRRQPGLARTTAGCASSPRTSSPRSPPATTRSSTRPRSRWPSTPAAATTGAAPPARQGPGDHAAHPADGRPGRLRGRRGHRGHRGPGRAADPGLRADPVRPARRAGARGAAAGRPADDQQVLHRRPGAGPQHGRALPRRRAAGVRDVLGQPGRRTSATSASTTTPAR